MPKITPEQLKRDGIPIGGYYAMRRGDKIAIMWIKKGGLVNNGWPSYTYRTIPDRVRTLTCFSLQGAESVLALPAKIKRDRIKSKSIYVKAGALRKKARDLELEADRLTRNPKIKGFDVLQRNDGMKIGCTVVTRENILSVKKLINKIREAKK